MSLELLVSGNKRISSKLPLLMAMLAKPSWFPVK
ncbi:hypothetical protein VCHENC02_1342, partial [Vibrio harveyi]